MELGVGRHKKQELEYSGVRYIIEACRSDRPAIILRYKRPGKVIELLHFYIAMGLSRQHSRQRVLLARLRDFSLTHLLAGVCCGSLGMNRVTVRATHKCPFDCRLMLEQWAATGASYPDPPSRLVALQRHLRTFTADCDWSTLVSQSVVAAIDLENRGE